MSEIRETFNSMSTRRFLMFGGLGLIAAGMLFGDVFAVFVLHQNAGQQGAALLWAAQAVSRQDPGAVGQAFQRMGSLLEDHGTKMDTHTHMIGAGYLALLLALAQPYVALAPAIKKFLARLFLTASIGLPIGIFTIHYVGLALSPFSVIGWASVLADLSGFLMAAVLLVESFGIAFCFVKDGRPVEPELPVDRSWTRRTMLSGGTLLVLLGFLCGSGYAMFDLYRHENLEGGLFGSLLQDAVANGNQLTTHVNDLGKLAGERAVKIAAHSHFIEFGVLAILLSFLQPFVFLNERWRRRWVLTLLTGSVVLPTAVALEMRFGLMAVGIADVGGLLVVVALTGMLVGVIRQTGRLDAAGGVL